MATINQEIGNPPITLERQVQTLAAVVERLTQHNQELEQQLNQRKEQHQEGPHDEQDVNEQSGSHLPTRDKQEREDKEERNLHSKKGRFRRHKLSLWIDVNAMRMAEDMQMMKEKMDMMMNAIRGRVSTNLDELVHRTDSPFTLR